jgi:bifunctional DNA-binding transcriptional regulator/antitoxin component of YhaV-PrlF toxin-antitoxin module
MVMKFNSVQNRVNLRGLRGERLTVFKPFIFHSESVFICVFCGRLQIVEGIKAKIEGLRSLPGSGKFCFMTTTLTINQAGQIELPEAVCRLFGAGAGTSVKVEVTENRIEIVKELPETLATMTSPSGRLVLAPTGSKMDAAGAVRAERDEMAGCGLRK